MTTIFDQIGVEVTSENKKEIDSKIHEMMGVQYKNCPDTWRAIKSRMADNEEKFLIDLRKALS